MEKNVKTDKVDFRCRPLLQSQIENAMKITKSNRSAAMYLRVSVQTYKKYATQYKNAEGISLYEAHNNKSGAGIVKRQVSKRRFLMDDILLGKYDDYPRYKLLRRLFVSGYIKEKCSHCGFSQRRPRDLKSPLIIHHTNGNLRDFSLENLEVLCYNCYYVLVGDIRKALSSIEKEHYERPEENIPQLGDLNNPESFEALKTMDLLTEEEKLQLLKELQNL
jgi:hypothetical protein